MTPVLNKEQKYIFRTPASVFSTVSATVESIKVFTKLNSVLSLALDPLEGVKNLRFDVYEN